MNGMTQKDMAGALGMTQQNVSYRFKKIREALKGSL
jgi:transcriptional regulator